MKKIHLLLFALIIFSSCSKKPRCYSGAIDKTNCKLHPALQGLNLPTGDDVSICECSQGISYVLRLSHASDDLEKIFQQYKEALEKINFKLADTNRVEELIIHEPSREIREYFYKDTSLFELQIRKDIVNSGLAEAHLINYFEYLIPEGYEKKELDAQLKELEAQIDKVIDNVSSNIPSLKPEDLAQYAVYSYSYGESHKDTSKYKFTYKTTEKVARIKRLKNSKILAIFKSIPIKTSEGELTVTDQTVWDDQTQQSANTFIGGTQVTEAYFMNNETKEIIGKAYFSASSSSSIRGKTPLQDLTDNWGTAMKEFDKKYNIKRGYK